MMESQRHREKSYETDSIQRVDLEVRGEDGLEEGREYGGGGDEEHLSVSSVVRLRRWRIWVKK